MNLFVFFILYLTKKNLYLQIEVKPLEAINLNWFKNLA